MEGPGTLLAEANSSVVFDGSGERVLADQVSVVLRGSTRWTGGDIVSLQVSQAQQINISSITDRVANTGNCCAFPLVNIPLTSYDRPFHPSTGINGDPRGWRDGYIRGWR